MSNQMPTGSAPQRYPPQRFVRTRWRAPRRTTLRDVLLLVFLLLLGAASFLAALPVLVEAEGVGGAFHSSLLALIPLIVTIIMVRFIDRWEPEPTWLYVLSFMWGAGVSVFAAMILNDIVYYVVGPAILGENATDIELMTFLASYGAPITEEFIKGLGVILIFFGFRRHFNGPTDGIVYGALIGAGFAFTENILYFTRYYADLGEIFQIRVLDGPFSHEAFTALFGFFIGFAEYSRRRGAVAFWFIPAMASSTFLHWLNNDAMNWEGMTYEKYNLINNVTAIVVLVGVVWYALRQETRAVREGLEPYIRAGLVAYEELDMVMNMGSRRRSVTWAGERAERRGWTRSEGESAMNTLHEQLIQLGHDRTRATRRELLGAPQTRQIEATRLGHIQHARQVFL